MLRFLDKNDSLLMKALKKALETAWRANEIMRRPLKNMLGAQPSQKLSWALF